MTGSQAGLFAGAIRAEVNRQYSWRGENRRRSIDGMRLREAHCGAERGRGLNRSGGTRNGPLAQH